MKILFTAPVALSMFNTLKTSTINQIEIILVEHPSVVLLDDETFELENVNDSVHEVFLKDTEPHITGLDTEGEEIILSLHALDLRDSINILAILQNKFGSINN